MNAIDFCDRCLVLCFSLNQLRKHEEAKGAKALALSFFAKRIAHTVNCFMSSTSIQNQPGKSACAVDGSKRPVENGEEGTMLEWVPAEVLVGILSWLSLGDLLKCALVCRRWSHLTKENSLWKNHVCCLSDWLFTVVCVVCVVVSSF
jgi:F-box-like